MPHDLPAIGITKGDLLHVEPRLDKGTGVVTYFEMRAGLPRIATCVMFLENRLLVKDAGSGKDDWIEYDDLLAAYLITSATRIFYGIVHDPIRRPRLAELRAADLAESRRTVNSFNRFDG